MKNVPSKPSPSRGQAIALSFFLYAPLLLPLLVVYQTFFPFVFAKALAFQICVEIALGIWLIYFRSSRLFSNRLLQAFLIFLGALIVTSTTGVDPTYSFWSTVERMTGVFFYLHVGIYFFLLADFFTSKRQWRTALWISLIVSSLVGIIGIKELLIDHVFRISSTLGNPIYLGAYSLFHVFFSAILFPYEKDFRARIAAIIFGLLNIGVLILSGSRGALLGGSIGLIILIFFSSISRFRNKKRIFIGAIVGIGCLGLLAGGLSTQRNNPNLPPFLLHIISGQSSDRLMLWSIGEKGFLDRPLLGYGINTFQTVFNIHFDPHTMAAIVPEPWYDDAHNQYIDFLYGGGLLVILPYTLLWIALFIYLFKILRSPTFDRSTYPLVGFFIAFFIQHLFVFNQPISLIFFAFGLGFLVYLNSSNRSETHNLSPTKFPLFITGGIGIALIFLNILPFISSLQEKNTLHTSQAGEALNIWKGAFSFDIYAQGQLTQDISHYLIDNAYGLEGDISNLKAFALEKNQTMIAQHPSDIRYYLIKIMLLFGDTRNPDNVSEIKSLIAVAEKHAPHNKELLYNKTQIAIIDKNYPEALRLLRTIEVQEFQNQGRIHMLRAQIAINQDDFDSAFREFSSARNAINIFSKPQLWSLLLDKLPTSNTHFPELMNLLSEAMSNNPNNGSYPMLLAYGYEKSGQDRARTELIQTLAAKDPSFAKKVEEYIRSKQSAIDSINTHR